MTAIFAGLILGLAGSTHCALMCGPLMIAWRESSAGRQPAREIALYHAARIIAYGLIGLVAGTLGMAITSGGFGRVLSIVAGATLIVMALSRAGVRLPGRAVSAAVPSGARSLVSHSLAFVLGRVRAGRAARPSMAAVFAGALNALLPCGLLYGAVAGSAAIATPGLAGLSMMAFGAGTTPLLTAVWWSSDRSRGWMRPALLRFVAPVVLVLTGLLLIGRGVGGGHTHAQTADAPVARPAGGHAH